MMRLLTAVAALFIATAAQAQIVTECDWRSDAQFIAEPWEQNTRIFANGAVRVAMIDTWEPAAIPFHVMVISPPHDELGFRQCRIITGDNGGFASHAFEAMTASYDPARGLTLHLPVAIWLGDMNSVWRGLEFTVNQATGSIDARLRLE